MTSEHIFYDKFAKHVICYKINNIYTQTSLKPSIT